MNWDAILTLLVLAGAIALFVSEKLPVDMVAILALSALVILGIVGPEVAISGFANEATITVAAMFVLSAGLQRTGALRAIARLFARIQWPWLFGLVVMVTIAGASAFVNNTAMVAVFLPLVLAATSANGLPPSKFLIPMSYAAQMGGVSTLIGTSTNLLVNSLAKDLGVRGFTLFEFAPLGIACAVVGIVYLMTIGRWLLPANQSTALTETYELGKYITELRVSAGSPMIGKSIADAKLGEKHGVYVMELERDGEHLSWAPRAEVLREGDVLLARGDWSRITEVRERMKLEIEPEFKLRDEQFEVGDRSLLEVMIAPNSRFQDETLKDLEFKWHYNATVLAIHRRGEVLREKVREVTLSTGDVLLMMVPKDDIPALRRNPNVVIVTEREDDGASRRKAPLALAIMAAAIGVAATGLLPIVIAALIGCVLMVVTRCIEPEEAYDAVDWRIIVMLAGVLPIGFALQQSGAAEFLAQHTLGRMGDLDPVLVLAVVYLLALVLSELMSNAAAAVLLVPIVVSASMSMGLSPTPFLVAVAFAASTSFSTPVGYQTNTMVYSIGDYRFTDFMRVGIPLNVIFWILGVILIPRFWPLSPLAAP